MLEQRGTGTRTTAEMERARNVITRFTRNARMETPSVSATVLRTTCTRSRLNQSQVSGHVNGWGRSGGGGNRDLISNLGRGG